MSIQPYEFCTYFDRHYLARGVALYESLRLHCRSFRLWVLCLDDVSYEALGVMGLSGVRPIKRAELESDDAQLSLVESTRSLVEYYFTCTPCLTSWIFRRAPEIDLITYLDADLFFFGDPAPLYEAMGDRSIAIVEHRFPPSLHALESAGRYNVGWLSFRRDEEGLACLRTWREQCLEWCGDAPEQGRFADQKYLDTWPDRFCRVAILQHKGANVAPWNLANYRVSARGGRVWIEDEPLLFFHFHGLKELGRCVYDGSLAGYGVMPSRVIAREIYGRYIAVVERIAARLPRPLETPPLTGGVRANRRDLTSGGTRSERPILSRLRLWKQVLAGRHMVIWNGCVISSGR